jgi:hypothetical protein
VFLLYKKTGGKEKMDGQTTNTQETGQGTQAPVAEGTQTQQAAESTPEKVNALQKFIEGLFNKGVGASEKEAETEKETSGDSASAEGSTGGTFTQADIDAAVEAAKQRWTEEAAEAERVKKLSPEERAAEEQQKKDEEISSLRSQLLKKELQESAVKSLEKDGFPVGLAGVLDYSSKEAMEETLASTTKVFKESLAEAVRNKLKGRTPEGLGGAASAENLLRDQIAKNVRGI